MQGPVARAAVHVSYSKLLSYAQHDPCSSLSRFACASSSSSSVSILASLFSSLRSIITSIVPDTTTTTTEMRSADMDPEAKCPVDDKTRQKWLEAARAKKQQDQAQTPPQPPVPPAPSPPRMRLRLPTNARFSLDRKSTRLNSSHSGESRMPSSA